MDKYGKTPSIWLDTVESTAYPALEGKITVDVAIIGAGITGLTLATWLKEGGRTVAVLDMALVGGGVSGRTTAHITDIVDSRYQTLIGSFGESGARIIADSSRDAIELIADMVKQKSIDCDFTRVPGYLYTEFDEKTGEIEKEVEAARKLGINCELVYQTPLPFPVKIALKADNQAQFHPLKYLQALAKNIPGDGSYLFENTHVTKFEDGEPCNIMTSNGAVSAHEVVLATHTPIGTNLSLQTRVAAYRSYVMGFHVAGERVPDGLYWDTEHPYNYIRNYDDVLIVGGRDHKTGQREDAEVSYTELERYARAHFDVRDVAYRWSAQVYEPVDNTAYIGLNPGDEHIYVATGYGGNGMTYGTIAARLLADELLGRDNPWGKFYSPTRIKPLASAVDFVKENLNVGVRFVGDRLSAPDVKSIADVPPGQGKIAELEGGKVAVYRSPEGELTVLSPECVHLGCLVEWNNAESTWDCPCHGGRYTATGQVIEGPPLGNLEKKTITESHQI